MRFIVQRAIFVEN